MSLQDMITEEHRNFAATRMVNLLASNDIFSDEVKQAIRIEGMKFLTEPRNFELSGTAEILPLPNKSLRGSYMPGMQAVRQSEGL